MVRLERFYTTSTKASTLWRSDKAKEKGFELLGAVKCGKVNV